MWEGAQKRACYRDGSDAAPPAGAAEAALTLVAASSTTMLPSVARQRSNARNSIPLVGVPTDASTS